MSEDYYTLDIVSLICILAQKAKVDYMDMNTTNYLKRGDRKNHICVKANNKNYAHIEFYMGEPNSSKTYHITFDKGINPSISIQNRKELYREALKTKHKGNLLNYGDNTPIIKEILKEELRKELSRLPQK